MSPWQFNSESQTLLSIIPQCIILGDPFQSCPEYVAFCIGVKWSYWSSILKIVTSDYIGLVLYYLVTCLSKLQFAKRYFHPSEESLKLPLSLLAYVNTILKYIRIYSSAELEPVYWHMVTRKQIPKLSNGHYFHSCPQVNANKVSFRLCHGLAGKACGGQWACTDGLYTLWVTESDNLSNITLICNLIPQHYQKGDDYVHFIFAATRQRSPESYFSSHKISV